MFLKVEIVKPTMTHIIETENCNPSSQISLIN